MAKSKIFKTKAEIKKTAQNSLMESGAAALGGVLSSFGFNAVREKIPEKARKLAGVGVMGVGAGLNVYAKDAKLKAFSHGVTSFGAMQTVLDMAPKEFASKIAMSASPKIGPDGKPIEGIGATDNYLSEEDYAAIAEEFENSQDELEEERGVEGLEGDAEYAIDTKDVVDDDVEKLS